MNTSIPVNHNFYEESPIKEEWLGKVFNTKKPDEKKQLKQIFSSVFELKIGSEQLKKIHIFNFKKNHFEQDDERLIIKLYSKEISSHEKEYFIQTGLYAGFLVHKGCKINITTKYGDVFLKRMLNCLNDIYVDTEQVKSRKDESENQFLFIIAYLFIQSLEKAAVLGLPQQYRNHQERSTKVRGKVDFNEVLKRDIPFQGKITSKLRERLYVQEIIDVLYLSIRKLDKIYGKEIHYRLHELNQLLKQQYSGYYVTYETIQKAKNHQSIHNPIYSRFKDVLKYAEIILLNKDLIPDDEIQQLTTTGYLFDIAELYELYLEKLLSKHFPDWQVTAQQEIKIYQKQFYNRSNYPDIVMRHKVNGKVVVFDAKFKKMEIRNRDVDRADLHQIHSYSGYYANDLVASGLIYPLSKIIDTSTAYSSSLYGNYNNNSIFIIDGIYVQENQTMKDLINNENDFIKRISDIINVYD